MTQFEQLSQRETDVAELLLQGKSNKQIAAALNVSVRAIESHLSSIYAKLGVASRTEAALILVNTLIRESTGNNLREAAIDGLAKTPDNGKKIVSRRLPMKKLILVIGGTLLTTVLVVILTSADSNAKKVEVTSPLSSYTSTPIISTPTQSLAISSDPILEQIYQLAHEYDQVVQAEKQNGNVEVSKDLTAGNEVFFFKDESFVRISELFDQFLAQKTHLENLYAQIYRDSLQPTPFPTQSSPEQDKAYYDFLVEQANNYCSFESWQKDNQAKTVLVYEPYEGKYLPLYMGDTIARCSIYGQMLEEFRVAPLMAKINQTADIATIHQVIGNSDLRLSFKTIEPLANAHGRNAAIYTDETGAKYYVDIETARLASIEINLPTHPEIPSEQVKSVDELRSIAKRFAFANSTNLVDLQNILSYEENNKGNIYFFRWEYRNKDWSGTEWSMMPPLLQVGMLLNGQIVTYINTLDFIQ